MYLTGVQLTLNLTIEQLVELAKQAEYKNPIEWGELLVDEDTVYAAFAQAMYGAYTKTDPATRDLVLLAGLVKLQTENFALGQQNKLLLHTIATLQDNNG
jgi:hypothetical protein